MLLASGSYVNVTHEGLQAEIVSKFSNVPCYFHYEEIMRSLLSSFWSYDNFKIQARQ